MPDPNWMWKQDTRNARPGGAPVAGLDDGGQAARGQAAELMTIQKEQGTQPYAFADKPQTVDLGQVQLIPPPYLGAQSLRAFAQLRTAIEGTRLTQRGLIWAAVILGAMSSPAEYFAVAGAGAAQGQAPLGSEAEAVAAMPQVLRARVDHIVGTMRANTLITEEEQHYWEQVGQRLGVQ